MNYVVGLTGGIGSGKSVIAELFARRGADITDADRVSHQLTQVHAPGWQALRQAFGPDYFAADEALDRAKLRRAVFADPQMKSRLEAVLHPLIAAKIEEELAHLRGPYALLVVPLLLETGRYRDRLDRLLVVDCPEETQVLRVKARSGLRDEEVRAMMASQATRATRLAAADDIIDNSGPISALEAQVASLDTLYREAAMRLTRRSI